MDLDELCDDMALGVGMTENSSVNVLNVHPHMALYKNRGRAIDQEKRRQAELRSQKEKRFNAFNYARKLAGSSPTGGDEKDEEMPEEEEEELIDDSQVMSSIEDNVFAERKRRLYPGGHLYKNQLMLAEWLLSVSPDFGETYIMKFCPIGRHVLVVASKGITKVFTKSGHRIKSFHSHLPGGGLGATRADRHNYFTVLDCIMEMTQDRLHVLDVMAWRQTAYYDFGSAYRFDWLEGYYKTEIESESESSVSFTVVPHYSCQKESMSESLSQPPSSKVDGVLFYHSEAQYTPGHTSLVGWLKPYMLPEVFNLKPSTTSTTSVHPQFLADIPPDYEDYRRDIQLYDETRRQLTASRLSGASDREMSATNSDATDVEILNSLSDALGPPRQRHNTMESECAEITTSVSN